MRKTASLLFIIMFLLVSCSSPKGMGNDKKGDPGSENIKTGIEVGNKAPDFALKSLSGKDIKLSDYEGRTVILNFFGVWCSWCKKEMPGFVKVYNEYKDKDVELLIVDVGDTKFKLQAYLNGEGFDIDPVLDSSQSVSGLYRVNGYPTTYIIDKEGIIRKVNAGYMEEKVLTDALKEITGE